jgi:hypothetical protein
MIFYRCDRCGQDTKSEAFYETELIFTPRDLSGDLDTDHEDRQALGDLCRPCSDALEEVVRAFVKPLFVPLQSSAASPDFSPR